MFRPTAIFKYDGATYTDLTNTGADITFISAATDIFYIGYDHRIVGLYVDLTTNGSYTGMTYKYLSDGETWTSLQLLDSYSFSASKYLRWNIPSDSVKTQFTSTFPHAATPIDSIERYWIKISVSAVTTAAVIDKIRVIPFASYASVEDVSNFLQLRVPLSDSTSPTELYVENLIKQAEARIDYRTRKSWKFNAVVEETQPILADYNRYGMYVRHKNIIKAYSIQIWDGASWTVLTEGRSSDFFINYDLGMIYITKMFFIPAGYGLGSGRYYQMGFGEFKNSVKVEYAYGRDPETDPEFFMVKDIATKIVAKDILKNADYSGLVVSSGDRVPVSEKVRLFEEEIEQRLDELTGIAIY